MDANEQFSLLFDPEITSFCDYQKRVGEIGKIFKKYYPESNFLCFFRGDEFGTKTQSKFFREKDISEEVYIFKEGINSKKYEQFNISACSEIEQLAIMQHYGGCTRLLDFSEDPLVALRFACGKSGVNDNKKKKITLYFTNYIKLEPNMSPTDKKVITALMQMVTSQNLDYIQDDDEETKRILMQDYFIKIESCSKRLKRQKGLFLFMGNLTDQQLIEPDGKFIKEKVKHQLSPNLGRGGKYPGFVGVLTISENSVVQIRQELEQTPCYRMDYLMAEGSENHGPTNLR